MDILDGTLASTGLGEIGQFGHRISKSKTTKPHPAALGQKLMCTSARSTEPAISGQSIPISEAMKPQHSVDSPPKAFCLLLKAKHLRSTSSSPSCFARRPRRARPIHLTLRSSTRPCSSTRARAPKKRAPKAVCTSSPRPGPGEHRV